LRDYALKNFTEQHAGFTAEATGFRFKGDEAIQAAKPEEDAAGVETYIAITAAIAKGQE
jgi:hypothetical protein